MADSKAGSVASWLRIDKLPTGGWKKMDNSLFGRKHKEDPGYANSLKLNMCLKESCDADEVKPKELRNLNLYDDQSREVHEATELLTNADSKQADEGNEADSSPPSTNELPKHFPSDEQYSSSDGNAFCSKQETPICWQLIKIVKKWYKITLFLLMLIFHLSPVVEGHLDPVSYTQPEHESLHVCELSTPNFTVIRKLKEKENCDSFIQQESCLHGHIKACVRDFSRSFLVAVCTENICLNGKACAEYQEIKKTAVITAVLGECPNCSEPSTLEDRMKSGEGKVCLKLESESNETTTTPPPTTNTTDETTTPPPPTTNTTTIASAGPRSSMPNINVIMLLLIIALEMSPIFQIAGKVFLYFNRTKDGVK